MNSGSNFSRTVGYAKSRRAHCLIMHLPRLSLPNDRRVPRINRVPIGFYSHVNRHRPSVRVRLRRLIPCTCRFQTSVDHLKFLDLPRFRRQTLLVHRVSNNFLTVGKNLLPNQFYSGMDPELGNVTLGNLYKAFLHSLLCTFFPACDFTTPSASSSLALRGAPALLI